jgi:galactitol-specific phosphotransferase system IIB component
MGRPAVILLMCGSSVATSNLAAVKLENEAERRKVKIVTKKGKISDFDMLVDMFKPDLVVATSQTHERPHIKVFSGVPLISTIGQEKLYDDIFAYIKEQGLG